MTDFDRYLRVVRRWLWLVILFGVIAAGTAGFVSYEQPKEYAATAVALVNPTQNVVPNARTGVSDTDQLVQTYIRLVSVAPVRDSLARLGNVGPDDANSAKITATREPNTTLVDVTIQSGNPQSAQAMAQAFVPAFNASLNQLQQEIQGADPSTRLQAMVPVRTPAAAPTTPVSPQPLRDAAIALVAGLVLGGALGFVLEHLDNTIKTDFDVRTKLQLPVLGSAIRYDAPDGGRDEVALVTRDHPHEAMAEAYRAIRTSLLYSSISNQAKSIVVTSSVPGEGKTSTATNIAVALAQAGKQVILVDADFRRPAIHKVFGMAANVGLGNMILRDRPASMLIQATSQPNLRIIPSGPVPPNPSELLGSGEMVSVISGLQSIADFVIYDTPPERAATDATILAAATQGVILVVEQGRTKVSDIRRTVDTLTAVNAKILGVVLNKIPPSSDSAHYYYSYYTEEEGKPGQKQKRRRKFGAAEQPPIPAPDVTGSGQQALDRPGG
jgi:capsular exopolysaccharide synthesis family protein